MIELSKEELMAAHELYRRALNNHIRQSITAGSPLGGPGKLAEMWRDLEAIRGEIYDLEVDFDEQTEEAA